MIKEFGGFNISSQNPSRLKHFYHNILGIPILEDDDNDDGVQFGFLVNAPRMWIWDEKKWGKSSQGPVNLVFYADNLDELYKDLKSKGVECNPPVTASWGGQELKVIDPDGNIVTIL